VNARPKTRGELAWCFGDRDYGSAVADAQDAAGVAVEQDEITGF